MVRGWQRILLLLIAIGVLAALASPYIPDPLSIPGRNIVVFAICLMAMFFPHAAMLVARQSCSPLHETVEPSAPDRLALICSRLC
jgi:uncharacterized membrane protein YhaH (DUF805 family)